MLADGLIAAATAYAAAGREALRAPRDASGKALPLLVLAMGKLGGGELNFSSDVDLVFLYPDAAVAADSGRSFRRAERARKLLPACRAAPDQAAR